MATQSDSQRIQQLEQDLNEAVRLIEALAGLLQTLVEKTVLLKVRVEAIESRMGMNS